MHGSLRWKKSTSLRKAVVICFIDYIKAVIRNVMCLRNVNRCLWAMTLKTSYNNLSLSHVTYAMLLYGALLEFPPVKWNWPFCWLGTGKRVFYIPVKCSIQYNNRVRYCVFKRSCVSCVSETWDDAPGLLACYSGADRLRQAALFLCMSVRALHLVLKHVNTTCRACSLSFFDRS